MELLLIEIVGSLFAFGLFYLDNLANRRETSK